MLIPDHVSHRYVPMEKRMEAEASGEQQQAPPSSQSARYKGVRMRKRGKWVAEVRYSKSRQRLWLGSYPTPEMAAMAYDAAVYCLRGPGEALNFPAHPPNIPSADRLSRFEILEAALRHAQLANLPGEATIGAAEGAEEKGSSGTEVTPSGEPLTDFIDPELCASQGDSTVVEGSFLGGGSGLNNDDNDGDIFGYFPLWDFNC